MLISQVFSILPKRRRKQIPIIVFAMLIGAAFEVLGIGLVIPLIDIISDSDNTVTEYLRPALPSLSGQNIVLLSVALFALTYVVKGFYLSALAWFTGRFTYAAKADVSNNLMEIYLIAPYEYHLQKNSAQLIRNLTTEAVQLVQYALNPLLIILSESIVIISIGVFLMVIEPIGTLIVMLLLALLSFAFQRLFAGYTKSLGKVRQNADGMIIQKSQEALGGIKDVKVLGKEQQFLKQFRFYNQTSSDVSAKQYTLDQLPRMYLETIGVLVFSILIVMLIAKGYDFQQVIPTLGVFALAAFRLLPSANRVLSAINSLRFADAVIASLKDQLKANTLTVPNAPTGNTNMAHFSFQRSIDIDNLCYHYPGTYELALSDINLSIAKGGSIGIIGKSGAGKSTLSDAILGLLKPSAGAIYLDGVDVHEDIKSWQSLIGYVQQDIYLLDDSIRSNIAFGEIDHEIDAYRINDAITEAQLDEFVASLPEGIDTHLGERGVRLSGGQKQRIGIARALYRNTPILVFDEATSALDNETETEIVSAIKSFKGVRTTIVIAHRLSTIEHCDRVIELKKGRISKIEERKK
ncbi:MAG: ABC transporter ATP-binding protein [Candidatus Puniceispirillaceae bacterium]